jgi:signal transduction histidine kinase/ActR/RegA family two-component response regulator
MAIMLVSTATALLLVAAAILTHAFFSNRAAMVQDLFTQAEVVGNNSTASLSFGDYVAAHEELTAFEEKPSILGACLYSKEDDAQYNVFTNYYAPGHVHFAFPAHPDHGGNAVKNGNYTLSNGRVVLFYYFRANDTPGAICVVADMTGMSASLWHYGFLIGAFTVVSLLATLFLASRLQRVISRPIFHLAQTAKVVSTQKNYAVRAVKESDDELGHLIDDFNEMLSQIQERDAALHQANDELEQRVRERTRDLEQQFGRISLLNQITHAVATRQDFEGVVTIVLQQLEEHLPVAYSTAYWFDARSETLKVLARGPKTRPIAEALKIPESIPLDLTPFRPCLAGEVVYVPDGGKDDLAMAKKMSGAGFNSCVATPLLVQDKVIGLMVLLRRETDAFSRAERDFIRSLGAHVALAIHQVQLYQDLQKAYNDLRQSQQAVMQQERLKALGQMASGVAHDINNALSPVVGFSDLIAQNERGLSEAGKKHLLYIKTAGEDIAHIVKRLREFYRPRNEQESLQSLNLRVISKQVIDMMQPRWRDIPQIHGINIELKTDFDPETPEFAGIESEIREALTNLLLNAIDALPKGGTITVRSRKIERPPKENKISTYAALEVCDTGVGMDEQTQKRCLEPFFSTKGKRGTGLGLAMVYGVVERHDGKIEIESRPGKGTTMRLLFAGRPMAVSPNTEPPESDEPPAPLHILCIDDEPALRTLVHEILEHDGHKIEMADGGQAGINAFQAAKKRKDPFDVVITDLGMPMVDGHAVARAVKGQSSRTPVIMLTGWGAFFRGDGDVPTEVDGILCKPPRLHEIRSMLRRVTCSGKR